MSESVVRFRECAGERIEKPVMPLPIPEYDEIEVGPCEWNQAKFILGDEWLGDERVGGDAGD